MNESVINNGLITTMNALFTFLIYLFVAFRPGSSLIIKTAIRNNRLRLYQSLESTTEGTVRENQPSVFIFGLGYVGSLLATSLKSDGWRVSGTSTDIKKIKALRELGIRATFFDDKAGGGKLVQEEAMEDLYSSSHILSTIAPTTFSNGDPVLAGHGADLTKAAIGMSSSTGSHLKWIGYLSSTGVYGDRDGAWVTEADPLRPDSPKTRMRAEAERDWGYLYERGLPVHTFRLAGIYGPGRSALDTLQRVKSNPAELQALGASDDETFISRIHVDDIVNFVRASMLNPTPGLLVNLADDLPSTRFDVLTYCYRLLGYPIVQQPDRRGSGGDGSRRMPSRGGSKRVDNQKMRSMLKKWGSTLKYPDYRVGLAAVLEENQLLASTPSTSSSSPSSPSSSLEGAGITTDSNDELEKISLTLSRIENEISALKLQVNEIQKRKTLD